MPANLIIHCIHRSNYRADAPKLLLNDSFFEHHVAQCMPFFEAHHIVSRSCLHAGPNSPSCSSASSSSGWFLSSLSFPLFLDPVCNESLFCSSQSSPRLCIFLTLWSQSVSLASTLYQGSSSHLLFLCTSCCHFAACSSLLDQAASMSSASRKGIFVQSGEMPSSPLSQGLPTSLPVQHRSSPHTVPGNPCVLGIGEVRHFLEVSTRSQKKKLLRATWVQVLAWEVRVP